MNNILGRINDEYEYEFSVVVPREDGDYDWIADYAYADPAYQKAKEINGIVAHNVRVQHKRPRKKKK